MKLWPQSLLWRTVVLLALIIVISQLAWFSMVRWLDREPRAQQIAQQAASVVDLTRTALIAVAPAKRRFFLMELHQQQGIRIYPATPGESAGFQPQRPFFKLVQQRIKQRLGEDTQVAFGRLGVPGLWVSFKIEDDEYVGTFSVRRACRHTVVSHLTQTLGITHNTQSQASPDLQCLEAHQPNPSEQEARR